MHKKTNATTQISQIRDGGKGEGETEDGMRRKTEKQGGSIYLKNTIVAYLCVYFLKMLLVVIFQYQILLA